MDVRDIKNVESLEQLASQGHVDALYELGRIYYLGDGVGQDYARAINYFEQASDKGSNSANYYLGKIYYNGTGVGVDHVKAKNYFEKSAGANNVFSEYYLGKLYFWGDGVEKSEEKANAYKAKILSKPIYSNQDSDIQTFYSVADFETATKDYVASIQKRVDQGKDSNLAIFLFLHTIYWNIELL